jgi:hypothetical protein
MEAGITACTHSGEHRFGRLSLSVMRSVPRNPLTLALMRLLCRDASTSYTLVVFTVITANFRILYGLFVIRHSRREIIHFNGTEHPTSEWVVQQLREAFPETAEDQYLIFDRDAKFSIELHQFLNSSGISAIHTSYCSPGRMESPKDGFEVFETICLIM